MTTSSTSKARLKRSDLKTLIKECLYEIITEDFISKTIQEKLIEVGDWCIQRDKVDLAIEVYSALNNTEKLVMLGNRCLEQNMLASAGNAFEAADDKKGLSKLGDIFLKAGVLVMALKYYKLSGNDLMVEFIKENFSERDLEKIYA